MVRGLALIGAAVTIVEADAGNRSGAVRRGVRHVFTLPALGKIRRRTPGSCMIARPVVGRRQAEDP